MGRERRRKDPINRMRRFLYGLLLLAAAPGAAAADELAYFGKYRNAQTVASTPERRAVATVQGLVVLRADADAALLQLALDTVTAQIHDPEAEGAPHFLIAAERTGRVPEGAAFDLAVAEFGTFHLDLLPRYDAGAWSLGGTLELVRLRDAGGHLATVPEVRVPGLHRNETRYLPFEASLKRSDTAGVQQLTFKWRA